MAHARRIRIPVKTTVHLQRVQLTLTEGEADFLLGLMAKVGGSRKNSPRKYAIRIQSALTQATGMNYRDTDFWALSVPSTVVGFRPYESDPAIRERGKVNKPDAVRYIPADTEHS